MIALALAFSCAPAPAPMPLDTPIAIGDFRTGPGSCVEFGADGLARYTAAGEPTGAAVLNELHRGEIWIAMEGTQSAIVWALWPTGDGWRLTFESEYHGRHDWPAEPCPY